MLLLRSAVLLLALAPLFAVPASAQTFGIDAAVSGGGPSADSGDGIALAADGSRYVVGTFEDTATFGNLSITSAGDSDIFLVKYAGTDAVWARRAGTDVFNDFGGAVAVAPDGSVYATGFFTGVATWDGGGNPDIELTTFSDFDAFVAKYTPAGNLAWVRQAGGVGQDTGRDVAVDAEGNVYLVGGFEGVGTFGSVTLTSAGSSDAFLVKYDPEGEVVWARRGGSDQGDLTYGVAVTDDGQAHVSGSFRGVALFGGLPIQSAGATDVFVVQYDADGEAVWVEGIGADGSEFTRGGGIGLGPDGSVYVQGSFSNTILIGSDVLESIGFTDIYVAKLTSEGDEVWGVRGGGDGTNFSAALAVDANGNALATGYVDGNGTFADEPIATQGRDGYFAVFDSEGDLVTVELLGGTEQDAGTGVAANVDHFAATGSFRGTASFGDLDLTSAGSSDVFGVGGTVDSSGPGSVIFVDADATGAETGLSWADAFPDLQDALVLASTIDFDSLAIWVAEGTYYPTDDGDRSVSFAMQSGLALYGGFDGTETVLDQRDPETNETTLSGDVGLPGERQDNSYHVVASRFVQRAELNGFTITSGFADGPFDGDYVGAAALVLGSQIALVSNTFFRNEASESGGGVYAEDSDLYVSRSVFRNNSALLGGGIRAIDGLTHVVNTELIGNQASTGGAIDARGETLINRCLLSFNRAGRGAGISYRGTSLTLINSEVRNNSASTNDDFGGGGGLFAIDGVGSVFLFNTLFAGNEMLARIVASGGGAFINADTLVIVNSTFTENDAFAPPPKGGFASALYATRATIRNSIFWNNGAGEISVSELDISRSIVEGGAEGTDILDADPLFDDTSSFRLQQGSPAIDFGLAEFLPPDTFDLDGDGDTEEPLPVDPNGEPRIQGNEVDLGAYESPFAVALEPGTGVPTTSGLAAAYPNPFRNRTTLALDVAEAQDVTMELFDVLGRRVATVHDGPLAVGVHRIVIEARGLPAGVYVVRVEGETFSQSQRVTVVR